MMKKLLFLLFSLAVLLQAAPKVQYSPDDFRRISAMLAQVLDKNHYSDVRMSDELSCRIFDNFIDDLDPERIFFKINPFRREIFFYLLFFNGIFFPPLRAERSSARAMRMDSRVLSTEQISKGLSFKMHSEK